MIWISQESNERGERMDIPTRNLGRYVRDKGINIMNMARITGIPYGALYDSLLSAKRERDLRLGEALTVCAFLGVDPMDFTEDSAEWKGGRGQEDEHTIG